MPMEREKYPRDWEKIAAEQEESIPKKEAEN